MKVLVISNFYPPYHGGGYGLLCSRIAIGLADLGHSIRILCSSTPEMPRQQDCDPVQSSFPIDRLLDHRNSLKPGTLLLKTLHNRRTILRVINQFNPDVVYCFGFDEIGFDAYDAATESGIPSVTYLGDTWLSQAWRNLYRYDSWAALASGHNGNIFFRPLKRGIGLLGRIFGIYVRERPRSLRPIHSISHFILDDLRDAGAPISSDDPVIRPPLPGPYLSADGEPIGRLGPRSSTLRALFVSRMERLKGPDTAVEAVSFARAQGADVSLTLAGIPNENMISELTELASRLEIADRVEFKGSLASDQIVNLYRQSDVFLFPSRIVEGFGMVNAEAMACGLPVLGTAHSGSSEIIRDDETGFRFPAGDSRALGILLARLHFDRPLLERLSSNALQEARRHCLDVLVREIADDLSRWAAAEADPVGMASRHGRIADRGGEKPQKK